MRINDLEFTRVVWVGDTHWQLLRIGDLESSGKEERGRGKEDGPVL